MDWPDFVPPPGDTSAARETSREIGEPHRLEIGGFYVVNTAAGFRQVDLTGLNPPRKTGHPVFRDVAGLVHYYDKHADAGSEVFADKERSRIVAVLDAHTTDGARWQQHIAVLQLADETAMAEAVREFTVATEAVVMNGIPGV